MSRKSSTPQPDRQSNASVTKIYVNASASLCPSSNDGSLNDSTTQILEQINEKLDKLTCSDADSSAIRSSTSENKPITEEEKYIKKTAQYLKHCGKKIDKIIKASKQDNYRTNGESVCCKFDYFKKTLLANYEGDDASKTKLKKYIDAEYTKEKKSHTFVEIDNVLYIRKVIKADVKASCLKK